MCTCWTGEPFKNGSSSVITIILTTLTEIAIQSVIKSFHKFTSHFHKLCVILNLIQTNLSSDARLIYYTHLKLSMWFAVTMAKSAPIFFTLLLYRPWWWTGIIWLVNTRNSQTILENVIKLQTITEIARTNATDAIAWWVNFLHFGSSIWR